MKLPRWLVVAMLSSSALAVLATAGWWWLTWPEQTAREFVERLVTNQIEPSWRDMLSPENDSIGLSAIAMQLAPPQNWSDVERLSRSGIDRCVGRQSFKTAGEMAWTFTVERGRVIGPSQADAKLLIQKYKKARKVLIPKPRNAEP